MSDWWLAAPSPGERSAIYQGPVSVKGVVLQGREVVLLRNERDAWELPGGPLERRETPALCLARTIAADTGVLVRPGPILDAWLLTESEPDAELMVVTYGCYPAPFDAPRLSAEHSALELFRVEELDLIALPEGYQRSIRAWARDPRAINRWA